VNVGRGILVLGTLEEQISCYRQSHHNTPYLRLPLRLEAPTLQLNEEDCFSSSWYLDTDVFVGQDVC
jgi:hypothetical protein